MENRTINIRFECTPGDEKRIEGILASYNNQVYLIEETLSPTDITQPENGCIYTLKFKVRKN